MKPYGIPRVPEIDFPDVGDIQRFGFKSSCGKIVGKSGDFHPYLCPNHKARTRRIWKRKARAEGKATINNALREEE